MCSDVLLTATQQLNAKVFKFNRPIEYLHIYSPKVAIFKEKKPNRINNVLSKVRFTENIEILPKTRFRRYSYNEYFEYTETPPLSYDECMNSARRPPTCVLRPSA